MDRRVLAADAVRLADGSSEVAEKGAACTANSEARANSPRPRSLKGGGQAARSPSFGGKRQSGALLLTREGDEQSLAVLPFEEWGQGGFAVDVKADRCFPASTLPRRRRDFLRAAVGGSAALLAGCDALSRSDRLLDTLALAEPLNRRLQRFVTGDRLAREFPAHMISPVFRPNGSIDPRTPEYLALKAGNFAAYRLRIRGLVEQPLEFAMDALRAMPARTQITRHDCVEGWSVIGEWTGVPLAHLLALAKPKDAARYVVFHCYDDLLGDGSRYYESVDLNDAQHAQTIAAYALNGAPVPVANGAPLRMRIERKLGYKQPKYVHTIELVDSYARLSGGRGGTWEDHGYDWYGGI